MTVDLSASWDLRFIIIMWNFTWRTPAQGEEQTGSEHARVCGALCRASDNRLQTKRIHPQIPANLPLYSPGFLLTGQVLSGCGRTMFRTGSSRSSEQTLLQTNKDSFLNRIFIPKLSCDSTRTKHNMHPIIVGGGASTTFLFPMDTLDILGRRGGGTRTLTG